MMRVLCINTEGWENETRTWYGSIKWVDCDGPKFGEECTVVGDEGEYYILKEWPYLPKEDTWHKSEFIPLTGEKENTNARELISQLQAVVPDWMEKLVKKYSTNVP